MTVTNTLAIVLAAVLAAGTLGAEPPRFGRSAPRPPSGERLVPVEVMADVDRVHPGQRFHLAVVMTIEKDWHIYWINPGYSGMPTDVRVTAPSGYRVGPLRYPRPKVIRDPEGITYGYEGKAVLVVPVTAPATLPDGAATFDLDVRWLVCKGVCFMGSAKRSVTVPTASGPRPNGAAPRPPAAIAAHLERLPRPLPSGADGSIEITGDRLVLRGPARGRTTVELYPVETPGVTIGRPVARIVGDRFEIEAPIEIDPDDALGAAITVAGLVALGDRPTDPSYEFSLALDATGRPAP